MNVDPNKLIEILSNRHAQKITQLEQEIAILLASNSQLSEELEKLKGEEK